MAPRIYFKHFGDGTEEERAFHEVLGRSVVLWGRFEATIDYTMLRVMQNERATISTEVIPTSFKRKADLWIKLFSSEPMVSKWGERGTKLGSAAKGLFSRRNDLIHASIEPLNGESTNGFIYEHKPDGRIYSRTLTVSTRKLLKLEADTMALYRQLSTFAVRAMLASISQRVNGQSEVAPENRTGG